MSDRVGTFILDFQTINYERDSKIVTGFISDLQRTCQLENQYALDPSLERAGWSFSKLFLSGEFVEKIYGNHSYEIDRSKGKRFVDKFTSWLADELKRRGCEAQIKIAQEMR